MAIGPGKYDALATQAREQAKARGVVLVVVDGEHGAGFSVQGEMAVIAALPKLLRTMATAIEADLAG